VRVAGATTTTPAYVSDGDSEHSVGVLNRPPPMGLLDTRGTEHGAKILIRGGGAGVVD